MRRNGFMHRSVILREVLVSRSCGASNRLLHLIINWA